MNGNNTDKRLNIGRTPKFLVVATSGVDSIHSLSFKAKFICTSCFWSHISTLLIWFQKATLSNVATWVEKTKFDYLERSITPG